MTPETAAMAEQLWLDFIRVMLLAFGAAWGVALCLVVVREALRGPDARAAVRAPGVTARAAGERRAPAGERPVLPRPWSGGRSARRRWVGG